MKTKAKKIIDTNGYGSRHFWDGFGQSARGEGYRLESHSYEINEEGGWERIGFTLVSVMPMSQGDIAVEIVKKDGERQTRVFMNQPPKLSGRTLEDVERYDQAVHRTASMMRYYQTMSW